MGQKYLVHDYCDVYITLPNQVEEIAKFINYHNSELRWAQRTDWDWNMCPDCDQRRTSYQIKLMERFFNEPQAEAR